MRSKLLRLLGMVAYAAALFALFSITAYVAFSAFVRSGVTRTPNLVGMTPETAATALADQGLVLSQSELEGRYSEEVAAGAIVRQDPPTGTLVKRGAPVEVVLSLGPQRIAVPDLTGQALPAAQVGLAAAGLSLGRTVNVYSTGGVPGTVVEQSPPAGATVSPETPIDLLLSLAGATESYLMPDLVYRNYESVRRFFEQRGFRFGSIRFEPYEGITEGVILRQFPLAGHPVSRRDTISLVVATPEDRQR